MIGPDPIMRIFLMSLRFGIQQRSLTWLQTELQRLRYRAMKSRRLLANANFCAGATNFPLTQNMARGTAIAVRIDWRKVSESLPVQQRRIRVEGRLAVQYIGNLS